MSICGKVTNKYVTFLQMTLISWGKQLNSDQLD